MMNFFNIRRVFYIFGLRIFDYYLILSSILRGTRTILSKAGYRFEIRRATSDAYVISEIWDKQIYGPRPHGIVIDLGANIGAFSIFSSASARKVVAVEPVELNVVQLKANLKINNIKNVIIHEGAVGNTNGTCSIRVNTVNFGASSIVSNWGHARLASMVTLPRLIEMHKLDGVDFLKIDVEGAEFDIIEATPLEILERIKRIAMEVHSFYFEQSRTERLVRKLIAAGFKVTFKRLYSPRVAGVQMLFAEHQV